jgi:hypothetical protein
MTAVRPPGTNRPTRMSDPARAAKARSTNARRLPPERPAKTSRLSFESAARPRPNALLSPAKAPAAPVAITSARLRSPTAAMTPAVMSVDSLGTSGNTASRAAIEKMTAYAHGDDETNSASESSGERSTRVRTRQ